MENQQPNPGKPAHPDFLGVAQGLFDSLELRGSDDKEELFRTYLKALDQAEGWYEETDRWLRRFVISAGFADPGQLLAFAEKDLCNYEVGALPAPQIQRLFHKHLCNCVRGFLSDLPKAPVCLFEAKAVGRIVSQGDACLMERYCGSRAFPRDTCGCPPPHRGYCDCRISRATFTAVDLITIHSAPAAPPYSGPPDLRDLLRATPAAVHPPPQIVSGKQVSRRQRIEIWSRSPSGSLRHAVKVSEQRSRDFRLVSGLVLGDFLLAEWFEGPKFWDGIKGAWAWLTRNC